MPLSIRRGRFDRSFMVDGKIADRRSSLTLVAEGASVASRSAPARRDSNSRQNVIMRNLITICRYAIYLPALTRSPPLVLCPRLIIPRDPNDKADFPSIDCYSFNHGEKNCLFRGISKIVLSFIRRFYSRG